MKRKIIFHIGLGLGTIALVTILYILAFYTAEDKIERFSFWASLILGTGSLITSVIAIEISYLAFKKDIELRKQALDEEINKFVFEHSDEMDFLPYCVYASCYDRHGHHSRKIYDDFCLLSDEKQKALLLNRNYNIKLIKDSNWIRKKIDIIINFAKDYGYGDTFLYDSGKHFFNGYLTKETPYQENYDQVARDVFGIYNFEARIMRTLRGQGITMDKYFESYAYRKFRDPKWLKRYPYVAPCDFLIEEMNLRDSNETSSSDVAYWMCHVIENIYDAIVEYFYGNTPENEIVNDAQPKYFEDKFYMILNLLYCLTDYKKYKLIIKEPYDKAERDKIENEDKKSL